MGRPKIKIDANIVEGMAGVGCSATTIATVLGVSQNTIERRFGDIIQKGRQNLNFKLLHKQAELALSGNATMLIWLGKQHLNQTERTDLTSGGEAIHEVKWAVVRVPSDGSGSKNEGGT